MANGCHVTSLISSPPVLHNTAAIIRRITAVRLSEFELVICRKFNGKSLKFKGEVQSRRDGPKFIVQSSRLKAGKRVKTLI
jgi:hypothetical protein